MNLPNPFPGVNDSTNFKTKINYKLNKAGKNGTLIAVVLDESGSMNSCRKQTIEGFNEFVLGQKNAENAGAAFLTLNKFDSPKIETVYADRPIAEVPDLNNRTYSPNGGTNLLDCIGYTIEQVNTALASHDEETRPGVIILIMTDGEENASIKFDNETIKSLVTAAEKSDWSFVFLGANIDAFSVGATFGMNSLNSVNYSTHNMGATMSAMSATTTRMRSAKMAGLDTHAVYASASMTDEERERIK